MKLIFTTKTKSSDATYGKVVFGLFYLVKLLKVMKRKLSDNEIERIAEEYPSHITIKLKAQDEKLYNYVDENFEGKKFTEKLYRFLYGDENSNCNLEECNGDVEFLSFSRGFRDFCSRSCNARKEDSKEKIKCACCEKEMKVYKSEDKKYCSHDCYIEHRSEKEDFDGQLEKAREKCREKHGSLGFGSESIKKKIYETMKEEYANKYFNNREKMKRTKKRRHGDPNYNNIEKARKIKKEKYGNPNYSNREKAAKTRKRNKYQELLKKPEFSDKIEPLFDIEDYNGAEGYVQYPFRCKKCDREFEDYLYSGNVPRCPNCYDGWNHIGTSESEKEIGNFIQSILPEGIEVIENDKSVLGGKELDVYIPEKDVAIEYDGLYWHSEISGEKDRYYHLTKTEACEQQGVQLIHIFGPEWRNKKDIVKSRLRHILGCSNKKSIYGRQCSVKEIDRETKKEFLEKYHLQGAGASRIKLGLFHGEFFNSDLVAVMTFGTPSVAQGHKEDKRKQWEMKRFALSRPVVGGTGKLFKHFVRNYDVKKVKTYADRRWSTKIDNVYEKIGFEYVGSSNPNYFYFHRENPKLKHRFNFRKNVLDEKLENFDPNLTEWENMQQHGYDRIWDCGHLKYKWKKND